MSNLNILIYGSYLGALLLILKGVLLLIAEIFLRPKALRQFGYWQRLRLMFLPITGEEKLFLPSEYKKLKLFRLIWVTIFVLLFIRLFLGLWLNTLDYAK